MRKGFTVNNMTRQLHYYTFPQWSADYKYSVLLCSIIGFIGGVGGPALVHYKHPLGIYAWHTGLVALLICSFFYIKGTYQKYLDCAWDAYY
jgi:hypothetical protein